MAYWPCCLQLYFVCMCVWEGGGNEHTTRNWQQGSHPQNVMLKKTKISLQGATRLLIIFTKKSRGRYLYKKSYSQCLIKALMLAWWNSRHSLHCYKISPPHLRFRTRTGLWLQSNISNRYAIWIVFIVGTIMSQKLASGTMVNSTEESIQLTHLT